MRLALIVEAHGEKWSGYGYVLKVEPRGFSDRMRNIKQGKRQQ